MQHTTLQRGFTLMEMIMVIVILGVVGSMVAVFMRGPIDAYFSGTRRAALSDAADTAVRRLARDVHKALPNSLVVPNAQCLVFIPTKTGGRYRTDTVGMPSGGASLDFTQAITKFDLLGDNNALSADQKIKTGDVVVVYNLGIPGSNAYAGDNSSQVSAVSAPIGGASAPETPISITSKRFPFASASNRFHVVPVEENSVAYFCANNNLYRAPSTAFSNTCPASGAIVSRNVSACSFVYNGSDLQRNATVQLTLKLSAKDEHGIDETVTLYHEVHVNNTP